MSDPRKCEHQKAKTIYEIEGMGGKYTRTYCPDCDSYYILYQWPFNGTNFTIVGKVNEG